MTINFIERNFDVINNGDLEKLIEFKDFPCYMGCVDHDRNLDKTANMNFYIGKSTGCVQLNTVLPFDLVYSDSHGSGTVGILWELHHEQFAKFISQFDPKSVFEIGGGSGILSTKYKNDDIKWTIIDANALPVQKCTADIIKNFFDSNFKISDEFDSIVHSHVLEHLYYPNDFLSHISKSIGNGTNMFFSIPNLENMFKNYHANVINFEHSVFLTEIYVDFLLAKHKFKVVSKEYFLDSHSIFYATVKDSTVHPEVLPEYLYKKYKTLFFQYINYYDSLISNLNNLIKNHSEVYLFGAHVTSQMIINRGFKTANIVYILDNDVLKQGKRLYGTNLYVASPDIISDKDEPCVILLESNYKQEIKEQLLRLNNKTKILEP